MNHIGVTPPSGAGNRDQTNPYQMQNTTPVMNARSWSPNPHIQPSISPGPTNSSSAGIAGVDIKEV
jgi:hypothetical protein